MALEPERAEEIFAAFGPVRVRRMFGGSGVYAGERMFALESDGVLFLKCDATTADAFEREGCEPFSYDMKGGRRVMASYRRVPERLLEDAEEMAAWARRALAIAEATGSPKRKSGRRGRPSEAWT